MPRFDKTGPEGSGPMTGRKQGKCNPDQQVQDKNFNRGEGRGVWRSLRRRFRAGGGK
jgi:hypothetical protein